MATGEKPPSNESGNAPVEHTDTSTQGPTTSQAPEAPPAEDRPLLISRARSFLQSPQIAGQDIYSKRQFLREKGLRESEIDSLLQDVVRTPAQEWNLD